MASDRQCQDTCVHSAVLMHIVLISILSCSTTFCRNRLLLTQSCATRLRSGILMEPERLRTRNLGLLQPTDLLMIWYCLNRLSLYRWTWFLRLMAAYQLVPHRMLLGKAGKSGPWRNPVLLMIITGKKKSTYMQRTSLLCRSLQCLDHRSRCTLQQTSRSMGKPVISSAGRICTFSGTHLSNLLSSVSCA